MAVALCTPVLPVVLPNPDGTDLWFHGTGNDFTDFTVSMHDDADIDDFESEPPAHWNGLLGTHWTSVRSVAQGFASGRWHHGRHTTGFVFTATLALANPARYSSELDMDRDAFELAWNTAEGHDPMQVHDEICATTDGTCALSCHEPGDPVDRHARKFYERQAAWWLQTHPDVWGIADTYTHRLVATGHDGIVYGNEIEGPTGHLCAVVFDPDHISIIDRVTR